MAKLCNFALILAKTRAITLLRLGAAVCLPAFVTMLSAADNYFGIAVNGTCHTGTSCPATPLPYNSINTLAVTYDFVLPNGDKYLINGSLTCSNNSNGGSLPCTSAYQVTYKGNLSGTASAADTLTIDWYNAFETTYGYGYFGEDLDGAFGPKIAASSSASECDNGGYCLGPVSPPGSFSQSATATEYSSNGVFSFDTQTTLQFGAGSRVGAYVVFGQDTPLLSPKIGSFSPATGSAGLTSVTITGQNLAGATNVTFHGAGATFTANSDTQITATVPCTATTGPIEVETPGGLAKSKTDFTVTGKCYSAAAGFSLAANPNGTWSYGYATTPGGTFKLFTRPLNPCPGPGLVCWDNDEQVPDSASVYQNPNSAPVSIENFTLPPNMLGLDGQEYQSIVRWRSPAAGVYTIAGSFNGVGDTGCGQSSVNVGVYQDVATALAQGNISAYGQQFTFSIPNLALNKGDTIDFTEDLTNDYSCDTTGLIATVANANP